MKYNRKIKALCLRDILRNLRQCLLSPHILDSKTSVDYITVNKMVQCAICQYEVESREEYLAHKFHCNAMEKNKRTEDALNEAFIEDLNAEPIKKPNETKSVYSKLLISTLNNEEVAESAVEASVEDDETVGTSVEESDTVEAVGASVEIYEEDVEYEQSSGAIKTSKN